MKWVRQVLGLSLALNAALFLLFFFYAIHDPLKEESFLFASHSKIKVIKDDDPIAIPFQQYSFDELVSLLSSQELINGKIEKRTLALALLIQRHFAARKIIPVVEKQEEGTLVLYDLTNAQYRKLQHFAKTELFPFECEGLFLKLKEKKEESLLLAFEQSEEFVLIKHLFSSISVSDAVCVELLLEGNYQQIALFFEEQKSNLDLSKKRLNLFLKDAQLNGSKIAGLLLTRCFETAKKSEIVSEPVFRENIAKEDLVMKKEPSSHQVAALSKKRREEYRVEPGDSLWKIAKKNNTTVKKIEECNKLNSVNLKPGQILLIP